MVICTLETKKIQQERKAEDLETPYRGTNAKLPWKAEESALES